MGLIAPCPPACDELAAQSGQLYSVVWGQSTDGPTCVAHKVANRNIGVTNDISWRLAFQV
jgi:hypothetical protein